MTKISDEDLIENIREAVAEGDLLVSWNLADQAADRIEQLVAINEELVKERDEAQAGNHAANEYEPTWAEAVDIWKVNSQRLEAKLAKAVKLIGYAIELGRFELNPKLLDDLIHFKTEIELDKTE